MSEKTDATEGMEAPHHVRNIGTLGVTSPLTDLEQREDESEPEYRRRLMDAGNYAEKVMQDFRQDLAMGGYYTLSYFGPNAAQRLELEGRSLSHMVMKWGEPEMEHCRLMLPVLRAEVFQDAPRA